MSERFGMVRRFVEQLPFQTGPAFRATLLTVLVVGGLVVAGQAVSAAFTAGTQPAASVDDVPLRPAAQTWEQADNRTVNLQKQQMAVPYGGGSTDRVAVRAVHNETHVGFRLSWADPTADTNISSPRAYSDAAAVMLKGGSQPPITMGATGEPVNIWYWRASWQHDGKAAGGDMYVYPHPANETKPGLAAGNPLSKSRYQQYADNYYAKGFGSLSHAPTQPVNAVGERTADGWQVTFVREVGTNGTFDASFADHESVYLAFAVWNGSAGEVNGQKSITLTFTKLSTGNWTLQEAQTGGGGSGTGGPTGTTQGGGRVVWPAQSLGNAVTAMLLAAMATWFVSYWRLRD